LESPRGARASLRLLSQPIQKPSVKVPATPKPQSHRAQAPPALSSGVDASTHRHRYLSMPCVPTGHSGLCCRAAHRCLGFFVTIDQRTNTPVLLSLCARASASVRPVLSRHPFLPRSRLCLATRSRPIVASKTAPPCQNALRCYVCSARRPRYNPHRRPPRAAP
jgi:hypothetical protein